MGTYIHLGGKIEQLLEEQHKTKRELASAIGMSASNVVYLCSKESMDVQMLHKIGNALKYNFFKHFVIDEGKSAGDAPVSNESKLLEARDAVIKELMDKLSEKEKVIEGLERDAVVIKQENGYLKEINELLKRKR